MEPHPGDLFKIANSQMPFGRYKGRLLIDLPEAYVCWFSREGWPEGELGSLLAQLYEIKLNGLNYLLEPFRGKALPAYLQKKTLKPKST